MMQNWFNEHYSTIYWLISLAIFLWVAHRFLLARKNLGAEKKLPRQVVMFALIVVAVVILIVELPISDVSRGQLLSLIGVVITGVIAISSTTFVANALGGFMLRMIGSFQPGDFVRIGDHFGRVTERGLFHTEIQTEDRDLSTLPNLYLVTNPVTVVHGSGTMVSCSLTLGYDVPHSKVDKLFCEAAEKAGLKEPFVFVNNLGDFSVEYKVHGFLEEVRQLLSAKSNLRKNILDVLHSNRVEIVSPSFMNQRLVGDTQFIPMQQRAAKPTNGDSIPEEKIFDKAEKASEIEELRKEITKLKGDGEERTDETRAKIKESAARIEELSKEIKDRAEE